MTTIGDNDNDETLKTQTTLLRGEDTALYCVHIDSHLKDNDWGFKVKIALEGCLYLVKDVGVARDRYLRKVTQGDFDELGCEVLCTDLVTPLSDLREEVRRKKEEVSSLSCQKMRHRWLTVVS